MDSEKNKNPWKTVAISIFCHLFPTWGCVFFKCLAGLARLLKGGEGLEFRMSTEAQRIPFISCFLGSPAVASMPLQGEFNSFLASKYGEEAGT